MNNEAGLFQAVLAEPEDEALRLLYADLMEECGDTARAEFIRLQCRLARSAGMTAEYAALDARAGKLLAVHQRRWNGRLHRFLSRGPLRGQVAARRAVIRRWAYRRGFVEGLFVQARAFLDHADLLFQLGPIQHLRLWGARPCIAELARSPRLSRLVTMSLRDNLLSHEHVQALAASPHLGRLIVLDVGHNPLRLASIQALRQGVSISPAATLGVEQLGDSGDWEAIRNVARGVGSPGESGSNAHNSARGRGLMASLKTVFLTALGMSAPGTYNAPRQDERELPLRWWLRTALAIHV